MPIIPNLLLLNATIHTMDASQPTAEAAAIVGNRIVAVGTTAELKGLAGPGTRVIDAGGRTVLPGFNDAHVHFLTGGFSLSNVDLRDARSAEEMARRLGAHAARQPKGKWILGGDWDHESWPGARLPGKEEIDGVTAEHPVLVNRLDGHMSLANSLALKLAGITAATKDPPGGIIERDARSGEPTGILKDAAQEIVERVIPAKTFEEKLAAARAATGYAARFGVTSVTDMSAGEDVRVYEELLRRGELKTRIYAARSIVGWEEGGKSEGRNPKAEIRMERLRGAGDAMVRVGGLKGFADGSLGSSTALFFEPYADAKPASDGNLNRGLLFDQMLPEGIMPARVTAADKAGWQVMIHAIGDRANKMILDVYEQAAEKNGPRDRRFRIEHAQHLRPAEVPRFARQGVIASMQPYHAADDGRWCEKRLGPERSRQAYVIRSLLDSGATLAFGSDWTVAPLNPLLGIHAATTRQTLDGKHPGGWIPEQKISLEEAVRAYTMGSAYAEFAEKEKGSITVGKLADLVMLDGDLWGAGKEIRNPKSEARNPKGEVARDGEEIKESRVVMTIVDGRVVYEAR
ncbi:MAG TPA: amidohydrolase [Verrucomicrobiae bacterium]